MNEEESGTKGIKNKKLFSKKELKAFGEFCKTDTLNQVEKLIDERIKDHKDCDNLDKYEEQHMEHSVILAELKFIKQRLKELK